MRFCLHHLRIVRAIGLIVLAALSTTLTPQPASAASYYNVRSISYNVDRSQAEIDRAIQTAQEQGANYIFLQEVCNSQANQLIQRYDSSYGGPWTVMASVQRIDSACNGLVFTVVIAAAPGLQKLEYQLDPGDSQNWKMPCLKYDAAGVTWVVCSTHIASKNLLGSNAEAKQRTQIDTIRSNAAAWDSFGWIVTIGGDFNTKPDEANMNRLYNSNQGGSGPFTEFNRDGAQSNTRFGQWTADSEGGDATRRKIDYVFHGLARAGYTYNWGETYPQARSGSPHRMLIDNARVVLP